MARPAVLTVAETMPKSFLLAVETRGDRPAIREKRFGIWKSITWRQWLQTTKEIAYALDAIGFKPGDVASILSNTVPEWVYADMGVLCAGGVSSGIYPTDSAVTGRISRQRLPHQGDLRRGRRAARQGAGVPGRCPTLEKIVVFDMEGLAGFTDPMVMSLDEFTASAASTWSATRRCGTR